MTRFNKDLPCPDATLQRIVVSLSQVVASHSVFMYALDVPSNLAKFVPITVSEDAPRVRALAGDAAISTLKSNENDADTVVNLS